MNARVRMCIFARVDIIYNIDIEWQPRGRTCVDHYYTLCFVCFVFFFQVPKIAVVGSGGGFRAMVSLSGVFCALKDMGLLDCVMYTAGLSGSTW